MAAYTFAAVLHKEGDLYIADCPEVGTVSQGKTVEEAIANLKAATELYMEEFPRKSPVARLLPSSRRAMPRR
jgi:predicted RNase H-like HicB family nuclease